MIVVYTVFFLMSGLVLVVAAWLMGVVRVVIDALPDYRAESNFAADVEAWLRSEGY